MIYIKTQCYEFTLTEQDDLKLVYCLRPNNAKH